ncbi:MAG: hypothetical protein ACM3WU_08790 [Bacillota bacterium]
MLFAPTGNLLVNGDFEDDSPGTPPEGWESDNVKIGDKDSAFTGERAALLGICDPCEPAILYQDVTVVPLRRYQLVFQLSGLGRKAADLVAEVRWLDGGCTDIGLGLRVLIDGSAIGEICECAWNPQSHITDCAPLGACMARVLFVRAGKRDSDATVLDAVSFAGIC